MYKLTANKTKLYGLAKHFCPEIGPMRTTVFIKYHRVRDYGLEFGIGRYYHKLFLACCGGSVLLTDNRSTYRDDDTEITERQVHRLSWDELWNFGLLEEIPDLKED